MKRPTVDPSSPYTRARPASRPTRSIDDHGEGHNVRRFGAGVRARKAKNRERAHRWWRACDTSRPCRRGAEPSTKRGPREERLAEDVASDDGNEQRERRAHAAPDRELPFPDREEVPSRFRRALPGAHLCRSGLGATARRRLFARS